ncbi:hypothetical protein PLESTF_001090800 [Pleodorina starrii]|nr:hypothetical protein PLESTF_001090800 [Pleodorina starrii]
MHLFGASQIRSNCNDMTSEKQYKLAHYMTNCFLESNGHNTYECTDEMTTQQCSGNQDWKGFTTFQMFFSSMHDICAHVANRAFESFMGAMMNGILGVSVAAYGHMEDMATTLVRTNEIAGQLHEGLHKVQDTASQIVAATSHMQRTVNLMLTLQQQTFAMVGAVLGEMWSLKDMGFYGASLGGVLVLTWARHTQSYRLPLLGLLLLTGVCERTVRLAVRTWLPRRLAGALGLPFIAPFLSSPEHAAWAVRALGGVLGCGLLMRGLLAKRRREWAARCERQARAKAWERLLEQQDQLIRVERHRAAIEMAEARRADAHRAWVEALLLRSIGSSGGEALGGLPPPPSTLLRLPPASPEQQQQQAQVQAQGQAQGQAATSDTPAALLQGSPTPAPPDTAQPATSSPWHWDRCEAPHRHAGPGWAVPGPAPGQSGAEGAHAATQQANQLIYPCPPLEDWDAAARVALYKAAAGMAPAVPQYGCDDILERQQEQELPRPQLRRRRQQAAPASEPAERTARVTAGEDLGIRRKRGREPEDAQHGHNGRSRARR